MKEFNDLESLYQHLELNALNYESTHKISRLFVSIRDKYDLDKENQKKAQIEIDAFKFTLHRGKLDPFFKIPNQDGIIIEYPKLSHYDEVSYRYLQYRLDYTENPLLKSIYAHILWSSPKKHGRYAQIAVEAYIKLFDIYYRKNVECSGQYADDAIESLLNAYFIAKNTRDINRLSDIKLIIFNIITRLHMNGNYIFRLWLPLIELMIEETRTFHNSDFIRLNNICFAYGMYFKKSNNLNGAIHLFEYGEVIENKLGVKYYNWRENIAHCYETLMSNAKDALIATSYCEESLKNYKLAKSIDKISQIENRYIQLKKLIELRCNKYNMDITDCVKQYYDLVRDICDKDEDEIITFLMYYPNLLPRLTEIQEIAQNQIKQYPLIAIFPTKILDSRGNTVEHFSTDEEHLFHQVLQTYDVALKIKTIPMLNILLIEAIKQNKFTLESLLGYLKKNSWYGITINKKFPSGRDHTYNWLSVIAPAFKEYFDQMYYYLHTNKMPNLVLILDSLTLKLEGLIRDICEFNNITTFIQTRDREGRIITHEEDINGLLHNSSLKDILGEDIILFLKFILTEKSGYNLRNNIAHSLMIYSEYQLSQTNLVLLAILILGIYNIQS